MTEGVKVGWLGAGRMGVPMVERIVRAGHDVTVWNRTPGKIADLINQGAHEATTPAEVASADIVFSMVLDDLALASVYADDGLFARGTGPAVWVDCSTVSMRASQNARAAAEAHGSEYLCAPVSGNPNVVRAGNVLFAVSGPRETYQRVEPLLAAMGRGSHYVGDADQARTVKLATNALLGVTAQVLAEVTVLAERAGVTRSALIGFLNDSAVGSPFTKYKGQAFVDLDFTPTFTPQGQRKDLRLALAQAAELEVTLPVVSATEVEFSRLVGSGLGQGKDFAALILQVARDASYELKDES